MSHELGRLRDLEGDLGAAFRSADADRPSSGAKAALLVSLGAGVAAVGTASLPASATIAKAAAMAGVAPSAGGGAASLGAKVVVSLASAKWIAVSAVLVSGAAATAYAVHHEEPVVAGSASPGVVTPRASYPNIASPAPAPAPAPSVEPDVPADAASAVVGVEALPPAPTVIARAAKAPALPSPSVAPSTPSPLGSAPPSESAPSSPSPERTVGSEIAELDRARRELATGSPAVALTMFEHYHVRFPNGVMGEEARVLEIEALVRAGRASRARELGAAFLAAHPGSPLSPRVRRVMDAP